MGRQWSYRTGVFNINVPFLVFIECAAYGDADSASGTTAPVPFHIVTAITAATDVSMKVHGKAHRGRPP